MAVTLYATAGCPFCKKAESFLKEKEIDFQVVQVEPGSRAWQQMRKETGSGSLPQVVVRGEAIGGYSDLVASEATGELYERLGLTHDKEAPSLYDVIIIGGGPAGLSAAVYASRKILKTLLISEDIGGQVAWTYDVDNYLGFSQVEAARLISKFEEHVDSYNLEKIVGHSVKSAAVGEKLKQVATDDGKTYRSKTVIVATGKRPKTLNVPGEKELVGMGVSYCSTCDAPLYAGLDVAVAGGGNSAMEAVLDLVKVANRVTCISLTPLTADQVLQDKAAASPKVKIYTEHEIVKILGSNAVEGLEMKSRLSGEVIPLPVSGIIIEIGLRPNSELVLDTVRTNRIGEIVVDSQCRTGVAGVFACGDVTDVPYKQVIVAAGEGAKAALAAYDYLLREK